MTSNEITLTKRLMDDAHAGMKTGERILLLFNAADSTVVPTQIPLDLPDMVVSMKMARFMQIAGEKDSRVVVADVSKDAGLHCPPLAAALTVVSSGAVAYCSRTDDRSYVAYPKGKWPAFLPGVHGLGVLLAMGANRLPLTPWLGALVNFGVEIETFDGEPSPYLNPEPTVLTVTGTLRGEPQRIQNEGYGVFAVSLEEKPVVGQTIPDAKLTRVFSGPEAEFFTACHALTYMIKSGILWPALAAAVSQQKDELPHSSQVIGFATKMMTQFDQPCTMPINEVFTRDEAAIFLLRASGLPAGLEDLDPEELSKLVDSMLAHISGEDPTEDTNEADVNQLEKMMQKRGPSDWN